MNDHAELVMMHEFTDIPVTVLINGIDERQHPFTHLNLNDIFFPNHHMYLPTRQCVEFPSHIINQHINDGIEVLCMTKGNAYASIGKAPTRLVGKGDIVVVNPFQEHSFAGIGSYERIC